MTNEEAFEIANEELEDYLNQGESKILRAKYILTRGFGTFVILIAGFIIF